MKKTLISLATFLFCGIVAAQNQTNYENFLNIQFLILDQVQPLTQAERQQMDSIFYAEYAVPEFQDIAFNMAMSKTLTNLDYYKNYYRNALAKRAYIMYNDDLAFYSEKMGLSGASLDSIKPYLKNRSEEIALSEVCLIAFPDDLFAAKEYFREKYRKNISDVYLKTESKGASYNLGLVLQNREKLQLSDAQIDSIVGAAQVIKQLSKDSVITRKKNNRWLYERAYIMKFLNEGQVAEFSNIRSNDYALSYAHKIWQEAKSYKIDFDYDSVKVVKEVFNYQLNKSKINYIYRDEPKKLAEMENFLYKNSYPKILRQLAVERRKRYIEELDDKENLMF
ncbi:MAG: hypothetical protein LBN95_10405 [Prevotellaceae bacterium]|jgi:hypothetical protein|nr:hypothetical protein [Prevotellaceae bacterium]